MKFYLAKLLQLIGITNVGFGLFYGLTTESGMGFELRMLIIGSAFFLLGRLLEGRRTA